MGLLETNSTGDRKMKLTIILSLLMGLCGAGVMTLALQQPTKITSQDKYDEEASVIQDKPITERQKAHRKLYKRQVPGENLLEKTTNTDGGILMLSPPWMVEDEDSTITSYEQYLGKMVCRSDFVVIATVKAKQSQFTEDYDLIFTDYEMLIDEVLKRPVSGQMAANDQITLTKLGGKISVNERTLQVIDQVSAPLVPKERYLLLLEYIPSTRTYKLLKGSSVFLLKDSKVIDQGELRHPNLAKGLIDEFSFLDQARSIAASACERK